jgi:hypothetical protein
MSLGYLKPWVDITEQERIEAALRESESRLREREEQL